MENSRTVVELIQKLAVIVEVEERGDFVVFGSAAIVLQRYELPRTVNDLD